MEGQEVGASGHLIQVSHLDVQVPDALLDHEGVVGKDSHSERGCTLGDQPPDAAQADNAEGLVAQLDALPAGTVPDPAHQVGVCLRYAPGLGKEQSHRVLRCRNRVGERCVDNHHATPGGRTHVDIVEADSCTTNNFKALGGLEHLGGHLRRRPDDERRRTLECSGQVGSVQAHLHVDVMTGTAQEVKAGLGDLLGYQHPCHV